MLIRTTLLLFLLRHGDPFALSIGTIKLSTGDYMPVLGLGTWQSINETELTAVLNAALDNGYRLIDTAYLYGNEAIIGKTLKDYFKTGKLKREDVFITTKLPPSAHAPEDVEKCVDIQLKALQVDYIDLYLIHAPMPFQKDNTSGNDFGYTEIPLMIDHLDTWRALEKLHDAGKLKAIGLSNFNATQLQNVYDHARIKPANLQVECHIYWPQTELHELCKKLNISFTAYAPLGSPARKKWSPNSKWPEGNPLSDPVAKELADKHHKTAAQILLRYLIQRGMIVIPKTVHPERAKENMDVFDFTLSDDEMEKLNTLKTRTRLFIWASAFAHPFYPWADVNKSEFDETTKKN